jgi:hypothetical protein
MANYPSFLSVTHTILSAEQFRSYRILKIDFTADFCFWTELRLNGTQLLGLGLAKTLKVLNTIMVGNSLSFPMVYNMAKTVSDLRVATVRNLTGLLNQNSG